MVVVRDKRGIIEDEYCYSYDDEFSVTVDYNQSFKDMVTAGHYNFVHSDITTENFLVEGEGTVDICLVLFHLKGHIYTDKVLRLLNKHGLRLAKIEELLAFGAKYYETQRDKFSIYCPGSDWVDCDGNHVIPCLAGTPEQRLLNTVWIDHGWKNPCCFLAVRE